MGFCDPGSCNQERTCHHKIISRKNPITSLQSLKDRWIFKKAIPGNIFLGLSRGLVIAHWIHSAPVDAAVGIDNKERFLKKMQESGEMVTPIPFFPDHSTMLSTPGSPKCSCHPVIGYRPPLCQYLSKGSGLGSVQSSTVIVLSPSFSGQETGRSSSIGNRNGRFLEQWCHFFTKQCHTGQKRGKRRLK